MRVSLYLLEVSARSNVVLGYVCLLDSSLSPLYTLTKLQLHKVREGEVMKGLFCIDYPIRKG
jgi:hypothetical protein